MSNFGFDRRPPAKVQDVANFETNVIDIVAVVQAALPLLRGRKAAHPRRFEGRRQTWCPTCNRAF
jgi:hypothetical protein